MATGVRRLVLDVLKPSEGPSMVELSRMISSVRGVSGVNISLREVDKDTETVKVTIEGMGVSYNSVLRELEKCGAVMHSVDEVAYGKRTVNAVTTAQD